MEKPIISNPQTEVIPESAGCCGGSPVSNSEACCKLDEEMKTEGEAGCGCNSSPVTPAVKVKTSYC